MKSKRIEYGLLKQMETLSTVLDAQADVKEIEEALNSAVKATEMICLQVQSFMPKYVLEELNIRSLVPCNDPLKYASLCAQPDFSS